MRIYQQAVRSVSAVPGVERVALAAMVPMSGMNTHTTVLVGDGPSPASTFLDIDIVSPGYFSLLDIPIKQGREFRDADSAASPPVAIVNEMMAREFLNGDALGKVFTDTSTRQIVEIVGVIPDLKHRGFAEEPRPMVFFSANQRSYPRVTLHVRTMVPAAALAPALQRALHDIDRSAGITPPETMAAYFDRIMLPQRLSAAGAIAFAILELSLVVMALYGVIAFAASQRKREIGLRMALGASSRSVLALIMRDRKSTRLNSSHGYISYAVFCLKKKKKKNTLSLRTSIQHIME